VASIRRFLAVVISVMALHPWQAFAAEAPTLRQLLSETAVFVARKQWPAAESSAREAVRRYPRSREAQLTLAQVVLWSGAYDEARALFARLVELNASDPEALLGRAQAAYWSGDYRQALRDFEAILRRRPDHAEAQRGVREIRSAARPGYTLATGGISDDQPYRSAAGAITAYVFSDPLTKWELGVAGTSLRAGGVSRDERDFSGALETALPRAGIRVRAGLRWMQFPDGREMLLPSISAGRRIGRTQATLTIQRAELLRAAATLRSHAYADTIAVRWSQDDPEATQFAISAAALRYFDGNRGSSADAYLLVPFGRLSLGASAAWKNTRQPRFQADTGEYDPYWTPHHLREIRAVAATSFRRGRATIDFHLDGGVARDRVLYFPEETPSYERTFHPWRAALGITAPMSAQTAWRLSAERVSTVFYTANEIRASVAGRF
jgi:tetratricopeptide (TPR) repeat protein